MIVVLKTLCGCTSHMEIDSPRPFIDRHIRLGRDNPIRGEERFRGLSTVMVRRFERQYGDLGGQPWYLERHEPNTGGPSSPYAPNNDNYERLQFTSELYKQDAQRYHQELADMRRRYDQLHDEVYGMDKGL